MLESVKTKTLLALLDLRVQLPFSITTTHNDLVHSVEQSYQHSEKLFAKFFESAKKY